jgi:GAF domain-containing protein
VAAIMNQMQRVPDPSNLFERLEQLNQIGVALSKETDINRLLETILIAAKKITNADGGTLYRVTEERTLKFEIMRNNTLNIAMGGTTGVDIPFYPIYLYDKEGKPVTTMVAAYAVHHDKSVNISDAYTQEGFDFSGTKNFDKKTGYRSQSFLTVPMKNHENEIIGVLQLLNAKDSGTGKVGRFPPRTSSLLNPCLAGCDRAHQQASYQSSRESVRVFHQSDQCGDR